MFDATIDNLASLFWRRESLQVSGSVSATRRYAEKRLRGLVRHELRNLGYDVKGRSYDRPKVVSKESIRAFHRTQRNDRIATSSAFVQEQAPRLIGHFASGSDVDPENIRPRLELVHPGTDESALFRLGSLTWSVPVSEGYGRRIRFLVWDEANWKLMGLFALGDPVFNLKVRDSHIGWNVEQRRERLVNVLDAYVLGALPPYNRLLGGKVISCMIRSTDVRDQFRRKYGGYRGVISGRKKKATLALVTTSSSLGRSAVYDRLKLGGLRYFESIGFTSGYGHFQVSDRVFDEMRAYLRWRRHPYAKNHHYGEGPNWRFRVVRETLDLIGMPADLMRHGIQREVFVCKLAENALQILKGEEARPKYVRLLTARKVGALGVERWMLPRALRFDDYKQWKVAGLLPLIKTGTVSPEPHPEAQVHVITKTTEVKHAPDLDFVPRRPNERVPPILKDVQP